MGRLIKARRWLVVLSWMVMLSACNDASDREYRSSSAADKADKADKALIMAVNYPLLAMAEMIGGNSFVTSMPTIAGDPAFWQPAADTIISYQEADIILLNGAAYAKWTNTASLPTGKLLDTSANFREQLITSSGPTHSHGPGAEHTHAGTAFTTWLDMQQAISQGEAIRDAMLKLSPTQQAQIEQGFVALQTALEDYHRRLVAIGKALGGEPVLYSHPVYQYLQRAYQLNGHALTWEPDETPNEQQWQELEELMLQHRAGLMLWEAPPLRATRERLEAMGLEVQVFSPVANYPPSGDFLSVMDANISALEDTINHR
jgi:zinc transport system substrate-binding protein